MAEIVLLGLKVQFEPVELKLTTMPNASDRSPSWRGGDSGACKGNHPGEFSKAIDVRTGGCPIAPGSTEGGESDSTLVCA